MGQEAARELIVAVVAAGLHDPSSTTAFAGFIAAGVQRRAQQEGRFVARVEIEVRGLAIDVARRSAGLGSSPDLDRALNLVRQADALIAVSATAQGSYTGLFKLFFDQFESGALSEMPTVVAATGGSPRYTLMLDHAMRPLFGHLGADVMPTGLFALPGDIAAGEVSPLVTRRIERAAGQLLARLAAVPQAQEEYV